MPLKLERDNFIENLYIVLSCLIKQCSFLTVFCPAHITTLLSLSWAQCHPRIACHIGVLSEWESGESHMGTGLGNRVGATIPWIHVLSKSTLQLLPCGQVHCSEAETHTQLITEGVITPNQIPLTTIVTYLPKSYRSRISNHWATIPACSVVPPIYKQSKKTYCHISF